ncbi:TM2 domain-containing membrane protein YozV [Tenacibaculum sp. 190524A02b]|uniref:TM2 domain-containing membrane protein YozV n=1 Tax=Tenacibaculum vairaonense TaxID=3137860 RepID=A0ABP1FAC3_9FLAO
MHIVDENGKPIPHHSQESKRILAGVLAIILGGFGVHKFVLNYTKEGITTLALTVVLSILSCGILSGIMWLITFVEGIIYLTKTDEEFINIYQINKKPWF